MKIPTQNDFIQNREQAYNDLHNYIYSLFPNKDEDSLAGLELLLLDGLLYDFFEEFGEIKINEQKFKKFCESHLKNKYNLRHEEGNDSEINNIEEVYGTEDKLAIEQENNEHMQYEVFDTIIEHVLKLSEQEQARFKVAYLAIDNTLNIGGKQAPTDMPTLVRERIQKQAKGARLSFEAKKQYLREYLYPSGFWQKYGEIIGNKLIAKDQKIQKATYKSLLKKAKFSNTKRDKEKMANIVNEVNFGDVPQDLEEKMKDAIKTDIKNFMVRSTLKPIPAEAYTPRENAIKNLRYVYCKEYSEIIPMYVKARLENKDLFDIAHKQILIEYLNHRQTCDKCKKFEKELEKAMSHRIDRLRQIKEELKTSPYKFHVSNQDKLIVTKNNDLVRYYSYAYKHNPSDLNMMYLVLAYKISGNEEKARQLLYESKGIKEYEIINKTNFATQIKGE